MWHFAILPVIDMESHYSGQTSKKRASSDARRVFWSAYFVARLFFPSVGKVDHIQQTVRRQFTM